MKTAKITDHWDGGMVITGSNIWQCPLSGTKLEQTPEGFCSRGRITYPILAGVPLLKIEHGSGISSMVAAECLTNMLRFLDFFNRSSNCDQRKDVPSFLYVDNTPLSDLKALVQHF